MQGASSVFPQLMKRTVVLEKIIDFPAVNVKLFLPLLLYVIPIDFRYFFFFIFISNQEQGESSFFLILPARWLPAQHIFFFFSSSFFPFNAFPPFLLHSSILTLTLLPIAYGEKHTRRKGKIWTSILSNKYKNIKK